MPFPHSVCKYHLNAISRLKTQPADKLTDQTADQEVGGRGQAGETAGGIWSGEQVSGVRSREWWERRRLDSQ